MSKIQKIDGKQNTQDKRETKDWGINKSNEHEKTACLMQNLPSNNLYESQLRNILVVCCYDSNASELETDWIHSTYFKIKQHLKRNSWNSKKDI